MTHLSFIEVLLSISSTTTTVAMVKTNARSTVRTNMLQHPSDLSVPTAKIHLMQRKAENFFRIHKCVNPKCPYYLHNLSNVDSKDLKEYYDKNKYKLHYIYREFTMNFFAMDLNSFPKNTSSLNFPITMHISCPMPDSPHQSISNPLLIITPTKQAVFLLPMKRISKSVILKLISGLSWILPDVPSLDI